MRTLLGRCVAFALVAVLVGAAPAAAAQRSAAERYVERLLVALDALLGGVAWTEPPADPPVVEKTGPLIDPWGINGAQPSGGASGEGDGNVPEPLSPSGDRS